MKIKELLIILISLKIMHCDIPVHCKKEQIEGIWTFHISTNHFTPKLNDQQTACGNSFPNKLFNFSDEYPLKFSSEEIISINLNKDFNIYDSNSNIIGNWTPVFDQGINVIYNKMNFYVNFKYIKNKNSSNENDEYLSICNRTLYGWVIVNNDNKDSKWACFYAEKALAASSFLEVRTKAKSKSKSLKKPINNNKQYAEILNYLKTLNLTWDVDSNMTKRQRKSNSNLSLIQRKSFLKINSVRENDSSIASQEQVNKYINKELRDIEIKEIALNWDWTNVNNENYVSDSESQKDCGSCYIFSTIGSLESRVKVLSNNKTKIKFSRQFPLSCNFYTEGCDGGYPFLVARFLSSFEIVPDDCFPYEAKESSCSNLCDYSKYEKKYTISEYGYIGGAYGKTTEEDMVKEIRARGPIPGHIKTHWSFTYYKGGIFSTQNLVQNSKEAPSQVTMMDKSISWEPITHGILIVGYGEENGVKYWKCKNSWGTDWGEKGYFRIQRGVDECGIESMGEYFRVSEENRK